MFSLKKIMLLLSFLIIIIFKAQNSLIIYKKLIDFGSGEIVAEKRGVFFNKQKSIFFSYKQSEFKDSNIKDILANFSQQKASEIFENDLDKDNFSILSGNYSKERAYVKDDLANFNWKIMSDKKKILGYNCQRAMGEFRGRKYEAWFTTEIPVNAGPWKFRGLPGLILSVHDNENMFTFEATEIYLNSDWIPNLSEKIKFPEQPTFSTYKEYIGMENKHFQEVRDKIAANRPVGMPVIETSGMRDFQMEKSFEWETSSK